MSQIRTPPSLNWLLDKRARIHGEIIKFEKSHSQAVVQAKQQVLAAENSLDQARKKLSNIESIGPRILESLHKDLQAIDKTMGLHDIQINPDVISPICTPDAEKLLPFGALTRSIFEGLKLADGKSMTTFEIVDFVIVRNGLKLSEEGKQAIYDKTRYRLKLLCNDKKIRRIHQVKGAIIGRWALADDPSLLNSALNPKRGRPRKKSC